MSESLRAIIDRLYLLPFPPYSPLITRYEALHKGPVRGLDFSPVQSNLLASGSSNGEVRPLPFRPSFSALD